MKLGVLLGYSGGSMDLGLEFVKEAEAMGYDSAWTAEALKLTMPASVFLPFPDSLRRIGLRLEQPAPNRGTLSTLVPPTFSADVHRVWHSSQKDDSSLQ